MFSVSSYTRAFNLTRSSPLVESFQLLGRQLSWSGCGRVTRRNNPVKSHFENCHLQHHHITNVLAFRPKRVSTVPSERYITTMTPQRSNCNPRRASASRTHTSQVPGSPTEPPPTYTGIIGTWHPSRHGINECEYTTETLKIRAEIVLSCRHCRVFVTSAPHEPFDQRLVRYPYQNFAQPAILALSGTQNCIGLELRIRKSARQNRRNRSIVIYTKSAKSLP